MNETNKEKVIRDTLKDLNKMINRLKYNNAMTVSKVLMGLIQQYNMTLPIIKEILREMNSRIYLIGLPLRIYNSGKTKHHFIEEVHPSPHNVKYIAELPGYKNPFEYGLWVIMNGKGEIEKTLKNFNLTVNEIDSTLEKTGFLFLKEGNN